MFFPLDSTVFAFVFVNHGLTIQSRPGNRKAGPSVIVADMSEARKKAVEAYGEAGTVRGAARALGKSPKAIREHLQKAGVLKPCAAPALEPAQNQILSGTSTLVTDPKHLPPGAKSQWVKTSASRQAKVDAFAEAIKGISESVKPAKASKVVKDNESELAIFIPIGDAHIGMLACAAETGNDYDLKIAERLIVGAGRKAIDSADDAARCIIANMGDWFHSDNQSNQTNRSKHQLDVDSRWHRVLEVGIRIQRILIDMALEKFPRVDVINVRGNHDEHSSVMMSHVMRAYYRNDKRVHVNMDPSLHVAIEHGKCLIATHHGHATKKDRLAMMWAARKEWEGKTQRRIYCGHIHSDTLTEYPGCIVETVNTLAGRDAYAAGAGWISGRDLKVDTWHKEHGLINRTIIGISQIENQHSP